MGNRAWVNPDAADEAIDDEANTSNQRCSNNVHPSREKITNQQSQSDPALGNTYAKERHNLMSYDLLNRAFISDELIDSFISDTPRIDPRDLATFQACQAWNDFTSTFTTRSPGTSNEKKFKNLIVGFGKLPTIRSCFNSIKQAVENSTAKEFRWSKVRISVQGACSMESWDQSAKWLGGSGGFTTKSRELRPDLMTIVVEKKDGSVPELGKDNIVYASRPETISPPPESWIIKSNEKSNKMRDHQSLTVECKNPVWEIVDIVFKLTRCESLMNKATIYLDCALNAAEVLRYQWSRRYTYYFLLCGKFMRLMRFDRAGLVLSEYLDMIFEPEKFLRWLLLVFLNKPS